VAALIVGNRTYGQSQIRFHRVGRRRNFGDTPVRPLFLLRLRLALEWAVHGLRRNTEQHAAAPLPWCVNPLAATLSIVSALAVGTLAAWKIRNCPWNRHVEILYRSGFGVAVFVSVLFLGGWLAALASAHPSFLGMGLN
jgi:hypothetical protein